MDEDKMEANRAMILMQSFGQMNKLIKRQVKETALRNNLSVPQFSILIMMTHHSKIAQKKLQARTHFPKSTLSHAIDGLAQAGLINRKHAEGNRREIDLALSEAGKELINKMREEKDSVHDRFKNAVDSFTEEEFAHLLHNHQQIMDYFKGGEAQ